MATFILSDDSLNKYGFRILTEGLDLSEFRANPVLLYNHDRSKPPIGKWENVRIEKGKLMADDDYDEKDEFAVKIKNKVEGGYLKRASVYVRALELSEDPKDMLPGQSLPTISRGIVLEGSVVDIPGNKACIKLTYNGVEVLLSDETPQESINKIFNKGPESEPGKEVNDQPTMKKLAVFLGLSDSATEDQILEALKKVKGQGAVALSHMAEGKGLNKDQILKLAEADFETTLAFVQGAPGKAETPATPAAAEPAPAGGDKPTDNVRLTDVLGELRKLVPNGQGTTETGTYAKLSDLEAKGPEVMKTFVKERKAEFVKLFEAAYDYTPTDEDLRVYQ